MSISDRVLFVSFFILLLVIGYNLYNIYKFMPIVDKCNSGFEIINKCGCIPDAGLADLFNIKYFRASANLNNFSFGNG